VAVRGRGGAIRSTQILASTLLTRPQSAVSSSSGGLSLGAGPAAAVGAVTSAYYDRLAYPAGAVPAPWRVYVTQALFVATGSGIQPPVGSSYACEQVTAWGSGNNIDSSFDMTWAVANGDDFFYWFALAAAGQHGMYAHWSAAGRSLSFEAVSPAGVSTALGTALVLNVAYQSGTHRWRFVVSGTSVSAYVDGVIYATATDPNSNTYNSVMFEGASSVTSAATLLANFSVSSSAQDLVGNGLTLGGSVTAVSAPASAAAVLALAGVSTAVVASGPAAAALALTGAASAAGPVGGSAAVALAAGASAAASLSGAAAVSLSVVASAGSALSGSAAVGLAAVGAAGAAASGSAAVGLAGAGPAPTAAAAGSFALSAVASASPPAAAVAALLLTASGTGGTPNSATASAVLTAAATPVAPAAGVALASLAAAGSARTAVTAAAGVTVAAVGGGTAPAAGIAVAALTAAIGVAAPTSAGASVSLTSAGTAAHGVSAAGVAVLAAVGSALARSSMLGAVTLLASGFGEAEHLYPVCTFTAPARVFLGVAPARPLLVLATLRPLLLTTRPRTL
jgi:hypothetical protein